MMFFGVFLSAYLIGFSGAMMPGPMLGIAIDGSLKKGFIAGPLVVLGHGLLELVLVIIMILGLKDLFSNHTIAGFIGVLGGAYLTWMGFQMIKSSIKKTISIENQGANIVHSRRLILSGALVSITNPYFMIWWATTGIEMIRQAFYLGLIGVVLFFIGHLLADLTWYSVISFAFSRGLKLINDRIYRKIILVLGLFIIGFSLYFIKSGGEMLMSR